MKASELVKGSDYALDHPRFPLMRLTYRQPGFAGAFTFDICGYPGAFDLSEEDLAWLEPASPRGWRVEHTEFVKSEPPKSEKDKQRELFFGKNKEPSDLCPKCKTPGRIHLSAFVCEQHGVFS